ncbi:MAG: tetratricopeptide repeat protein [Acidobacteria bacterium]|nr:MAG: tetratricopeptide repeat protein [Acidobacteriota bacterium]
MRAILSFSLLGFVLTGCDASPASGPASETEDAEIADSPTHVGKDACAACHPAEFELWRGSHHDLAMQLADASTVLGDFRDRAFDHAGVTTTFFERDGKFMVRTDGPDGELEDYEIAFTFGADPLQQYLVPFPDGRYQVLSIAWDARPSSQGGERWFHLYPDEGIDHEDPLHWTKRYQNWNFMCASCHSTGLRKNYDREANRYDTTWQEMNVSCEACHGRGSRHVAWAQEGAEGDPKLEATLRTDEASWVMNIETGLAERDPPRAEHYEIETCAPCHSRRSQLYEDDPHGQPFLDDFRPSLLTEPLYYADGQIRDEVYVYGSFVQSKMYLKGVTCQDCHDPHTLSVRAEGNAVCASCHLPAKFDTQSHHFHEPGTEGASCVNCHMPETTYMVVDPRRDHSLRVPRPDLTVSLRAPNACNGCHEAETPVWAAAKVAEWYGHPPTRHYGEALHAGDTASLASLVNEAEVPALVKATALAGLSAMPYLPQGLRSADALLRLGALEAAEALEPTTLHQLVIPLLEDDVRAVRIEAARVLAAVPVDYFTPEQRSIWTGALAEYRAVQNLNADWPEARMNLGLVHIQLGELADAEREYLSVLELDPRFVQAHVNLADLYRMQGRDDHAEATLRDALGVQDDDPGVYHALGLTLVRLEKNTEAVEALGRAARLAPDQARFSYVYGVALSSTGKVDEALSVLQKAHERHSGDAEILFALVTMNRDRGEYEEASRYGRRLLKLRPGDASLARLVAELDAAIRK